MNKELLEALEILEKEKNIGKATMLEVIESSLLTACKNHFGKIGNIKVNINTETCDFGVIAEKEVVGEVEDPLMQISATGAKAISPNYDVGDIIQISIESKSFGRIATQNTESVTLQKIWEKERKSLHDDWYGQKKDIVTGIVQRYLGKNLSINLGKVNTILNGAEQARGRVLQPTKGIKLYTLGVKGTPKGSKISMSRTHPDLVKRLFESEVVEVRNGTMETKAIAREAGSGTKITVMSHDANVDPVGACVGMGKARVNSIVNELRGKKIDIITWNDNSAYLIESALSPAKVICMVVDEDVREAWVVMPDYQLPLAVGKEGQDTRLTARLTGYKIDIRSETQTRESGLLEELGIQYQKEGVYEEYEDGYDAEYRGDYQGDYQEEYQGDYQGNNVTK